MKKIKILVKAPVEKTEKKKYEWKKGKRILARTTEGIVIGTVLDNTEGLISIKLDNGKNLELKESCNSILGEGINRKIKSIIADDELHQWKRELSGEAMRKINSEKSNDR